MAFQQVIIPKGVINPNETTIVEIPESLKSVATVVARVKMQPTQNTASAQSESKVIKKTSYTRRTIPKQKPANFDEMHGGYQNDYLEEEFCVGKRQNAAQMQPAAAYSKRYEPDMSLQGQHNIAFNPAQSQQSTVQNRNHRDGGRSACQDFRQPDHSTLIPSYPERVCTSDSQEMSYFEESYIETTPEKTIQSTKEVTEYFPTEDLSRSSRPSGATTKGRYKSYNPSTEPSGRYPENYLPPSEACSPCSPDSSQQNTSNVLDSLSKLESSELRKVISDLSNLQSARRKLVLDVSNLASSTDFACNILKSKTA